MNADALVGQIVDQKYTIMSVLGSGGMGSVVKARQDSLNRLVAIKFLHSSLLQDSESLSRFEREAQVLSTLVHQHIGGFLQYGFWDSGTTAPKFPYIVMEYLEGRSLHNLLAEEGRLAWKRALKICVQITEAMEHVHNAGVLHRDLKPGNIILLDKPEADFVKVVDFGLSKKNYDDSDGLTMTGELMGSVQYMSPEQCRGGKLDKRSDIYSLGVVLYECLAGAPPHLADSPIGVIYKHAHAEIFAPSKQIRENLPFGLDEVVIKTLARDVDLRYQSMAQLKNDLLKIEKGLGAECEAVTSPQSTPSQSRPLKVFGYAKLTISVALVLVATAVFFLFFTGRGFGILSQASKKFLDDRQLLMCIDKLEGLRNHNDAAELREFLLNKTLNKETTVRARICLTFAQDLIKRNYIDEASVWLRHGFALIIRKDKVQPGYFNQVQLSDSECCVLNDLSNCGLTFRPSQLSKFSQVTQSILIEGNCDNLAFAKLCLKAAKSSHDNDGIVIAYDRLRSSLLHQRRPVEAKALVSEAKQFCRKNLLTGRTYFDFLCGNCEELFDAGYKEDSLKCYLELRNIISGDECILSDPSISGHLLTIAIKYGDTQNRDDLANKFMEETLKGEDNGRIFFFRAAQLFEFYRMEKYYSRAKSLAAIVFKAVPADRRGIAFYNHAMVHFIWLLVDAEKYDDAIVLLDHEMARAALIEPRDVTARKTWLKLLLAYVFLAKNDLGKASKLLAEIHDDVAIFNTHRYDYWRETAILLEKQGKPEEALVARGNQFKEAWKTDWLGKTLAIWGLDCIEHHVMLGQLSNEEKTSCLKQSSLTFEGIDCGKADSERDPKWFFEFWRAKMRHLRRLANMNGAANMDGAAKVNGAMRVANINGAIVAAGKQLEVLGKVDRDDWKFETLANMCELQILAGNLNSAESYAQKLEVALALYRKSISEPSIFKNAYRDYLLGELRLAAVRFFQRKPTEALNLAKQVAHEAQASALPDVADKAAKYVKGIKAGHISFEEFLQSDFNEKMDCAGR